jgi:hypothetical protein
MHRLGQAAPFFLAVCAWGLSGCVGTGVLPVSEEPLRRVFVAEAMGAPSAELSVLNDVVHDVAVRTLRARGYEAVAEPAQAEATLGASWHARPLRDGSPESRFSLRLTLVNREGRLVFAADAVESLPAGFLTAARVADQVRQTLAKLDPVPASR